MKSIPQSVNHRTPEKTEDLFLESARGEKDWAFCKGKTMKLAMETQKIISLNRWWEKLTIYIELCTQRSFKNESEIPVSD